MRLIVSGLIILFMVMALVLQWTGNHAEATYLLALASALGVNHLVLNAKQDD